MHRMKDRMLGPEHRTGWMIQPTFHRTRWFSWWMLIPSIGTWRSGGKLVGLTLDWFSLCIGFYIDIH